jgi:thiamine biosynthesis lipoprotein
MLESQLIMGMPVTIELVDDKAQAADLLAAFDYLRAIDENFSPYKATSELTLMNEGRLADGNLSEDMREVLRLSEQTKRETDGYFDIRRPDGRVDTCGLVKGWAIRNAARLLQARGYRNFFVDVGGDLQLHGVGEEKKPWRVGIRDPFDTAKDQVVRVIAASECGVATSGSYLRGAHIYNPRTGTFDLNEVVSVTVIGPDVYEADRFATAAFAMGRAGINFIERRPGFEGYQIDKAGLATMTTGFKDFVTT